MAEHGVLLRERAEGDAPAIRRLLIDAFEGEAECRLVESLYAAQALTVERLAEEDGQVIGYCAMSPARLAPPSGQPVFGLAPLAVAPGRQGRGIGGRLVKESLEAVEIAHPGSAVILLGEPAYYARFGFAPAARYAIEWDGGAVGDAFQILGATAPEDGLRRTAFYHPAFSDLS
ncbi:MAG: hypothetical protein Tsb0010_08620 [Parvularculaceae bacterium]